MLGKSQADAAVVQERIARTREETKRVPLFNLPEDCQVVITVDLPSPEQPPVIETEASVLSETEVDDR